MIIGAGPTGLGAAYRLLELGVMSSKTEVIILEMEKEAGGLASSYRDKNGFLWDNGGHVVFSHYPYFDRVLNQAVQRWNKLSRASYAYMMGSSGRRKFIPYPVQHNIHVMDKEEQEKSLRGLEEIAAAASDETTSNNCNFNHCNLDHWLVKHFGEGLSDVFMRKYNRKVWTVDPKEMNSDWVGERVAVPDVEEIKSKIVQTTFNGDDAKDSNWGPNQKFEFPTAGGTGGIWKHVTKLIPPTWFFFRHRVSAVNSEKKIVNFVQDGRVSNLARSLKYDILISTTPLDSLLHMVEDSDPKLLSLKELASKFVYSHTHVIGIGLKGQAHPFLSNKSWIYFPDSDSPFYRVTVFSNYASDTVPTPGTVWSLMCEAAEPKHATDLSMWMESNLIEQTIRALVNYGFIDRHQVISTYHRRLEHGYPVPFLEREKYLRSIQPWLESKGIYSRGRFGGWRYEVGNQDHSFMQGVEVADLVMLGIPEETYPNAQLVNSMKASNRSATDYELVVAHHNEDLSWLEAYADHCHIYHKGDSTNKTKNVFKQWEPLPNVGREGHTYLYHIINNYYCLADVTLFTQGDIQLHVTQGDASFDFTSYLKKGRDRGFFTNRQQQHDDWGKMHWEGKWLEMVERGEVRKANLTMGEFWKTIFGLPHPKRCMVSYGAVFAASRSRIISRPKSFYENILSFINDHPNPEEGHYIERLWPFILAKYVPRKRIRL